MTTPSASHHLSHRAEGYRPSPVRDFWEASMEPGVISLAGGNPDLSVLPLQWLAEASAQLVLERGTEVLQYGSSIGTHSVVDAVVTVMAAEGITVRAADIQMTAGSQMALEMVIRLLTDPGDVILAEGPTYVGALGVFAGLEVKVAHVATDDAGLRPDALADAIARVRAEGGRIRGLYTIPNFQNPVGVTMAHERRAEVVKICRKAGIPVIEDNPYGLLGFSGQQFPSLYSLDPENVIYLGSFSKIVSPGLRVGWAVVPEWLRRPMMLLVEAATICPSVLSQELVASYIEHQDWQGTLVKARARYQSRAAAVLSALEDFMPAGVSWTQAEGGFFTWLQLPLGVDCGALLDTAIDQKVVFVPGTAFYAGGAAEKGTGVQQGINELRLAYSLESEEQLREGVRRLALAVKEQLEAL